MTKAILSLQRDLSLPVTRSMFHAAPKTSHVQRIMKKGIPRASATVLRQVNRMLIMITEMIPSNIRSLCLCLYVSVSLCVSLSLSLPLSVFVCLSVVFLYLSLHLPLSVRLPVFLYVCLFFIKSYPDSSSSPYNSLPSQLQAPFTISV